uniref:P-type domain-containing protein n=1 Tax=Syphacia muris TaxID=451379 RepID=A0A0N5AKZ6_9BILA
MIGYYYLTVLLLLLPTESLCQAEKVRVDCFPEPGASKEACEARNCVWDENTSAVNAPYCYFPSTTGYTVSNIVNSTYTLTKQNSVNNPKNPYGSDISPIKVTAKDIDGVMNIRIEDASAARYEPPLNLPKDTSKQTEHLKFTASKASEMFSFKVQRQNPDVTLWDTSIGGLLFADQYIQIATLLPSEKVVGFGEHIHKNLMHDFTRYTTWPMFARDDAPDSVAELSTKNLYGVHPFYMCIEDRTGHAHGVLFLNSNAQEVTLGPGPSLVYRTIGGILDIYFFPGPTPDDVVSQYHKFIGLPVLPAYWALGYQLCRWGYTSLDDMKDAVQRTISKNIPLDVPYADIDYMNKYEDFTEGWQGFDDYVKQLQNEGRHVILIFDPAIEADYSTFNRSETHGVSYIDWPSHDFVPDEIEDNYTMIRDKNIMLGNVWPEANAAFPDFLDPQNNTRIWWTNEFTRFHNRCPFNGIWIDMNEPSNFDTGTYTPTQNKKYPIRKNFYLSCPIGNAYPLDDPKYRTWGAYYRKEYLSAKTLCMNGKTGRGKYNFYDTKSLYGWSETVATRDALRQMTNGKRGAIISRSTFVSSGRYGGHWLGDNTATWEDLRTSIVGTIEFSMFGIPYVGADICGFNGNTTEELCLRWHQLGAFYPFSRNHNTEGAIPQDPGRWDSVAEAARNALQLRYKLLPYLYSLLYDASINGRMVVKPLFFMNPTNDVSLDISNQFMWGESVMFAPILTKGADRRYAYFPPGFWYSIRENDYGRLIAGSVDGLMRPVEAPKTWNTPVFLLGGKIIPTQEPGLTTTISRTQPFGLIIALESTTATWDDAKGEMYWDDGESEGDQYYKWSIEFRSTPYGARVDIKQLHKPVTALDLPTLDTIDILGYDRNIHISSFTLNNQTLTVNSSSITYNKKVQMVRIKVNKFLSLTSANNIRLAWEHGDFEGTDTTTEVISTSPSSQITTSSASVISSFTALLIAALVVLIFY